MSLGLQKYNQKRDFNKTSEPKGVKKASKGELRFVVQKHAASHLHYDFRLEIDGVLVSWAVPKGPSANPEDKRLAMHVEDHPMDYIEFEGTIPQGEYGGGTVMVWDIGTYHAEGNADFKKDNTILKKQHKDGSIKIILKGKKLKGAWHLVEMKGKDRHWLLMKSKDEFSGKTIKFNEKSILTKRDFDAIAKVDNVWHSDKKSVSKSKEATEERPKLVRKNSDNEFSSEDLADAVKLKSFPKNWRPQLATLTNEAFDNDQWIFETKYDGYRAIAQLRNQKVELVSRNGISFNAKYPDIVKSLESISNDMIIDGEIVVEDAKGKSNFQWLQHLDEKPKQGKLKYYVFDILYFQGFDLRSLDLISRKKILKALLPKKTNIIFSKHIKTNGIKFFKEIEKKSGEGLIAKKANSKYHTDKRSKDWLKIKTGKEQEMVIGGFTEPSGSRAGIGALLCGYYDGNTLKYSGKVGSGYTDAILKELRAKLDKIEQQGSPFSTTPKERNVHWVKPKLVAQIRFSEFTETGSMRHPVFLGLRTDKKPNDVIMETPKAVPDKISKAKSGKTETKVEISNPDKIYFPKEKITKGDVIAYYDSISEYILPYLKDRPQSLRRNPDGIEKDGFFQKNVAGMVPKWVKTRKIKSGSKEESIEYLLCQDKDTLLYMANLGCIELNPWSSRVGSLNNPDYIIFDIDPKGAPMKNIVATALKVKEVLDNLKVPAYIKTSGGNGLHVFIPVLPKYSYDQTRNFSHLVSQMVHRDLPDITSLERMPDKRKGKVYLDFLQNGKGKTMASIYSLRPREGAGVSTPLEWDEVNAKLDLKKFNLKTIPKRLEQKGDLWKDFFKDSIDLRKILDSI